MNTQMMVGAIFFAALFCYMSAGIIAQITIRQVICLVWALTVAGAIYAADQVGLTDAALWHVEHWNAPASQIALLQRADTNAVRQNICAFSGEIYDWQGEVETALLAGGGDRERMFLAIKVAPNVTLADAVRYDDMDNPVYKGTPAFDQAERLSTDQHVLISGTISPLQTSCQASPHDDGRYTLLISPSRIVPDQSLLLIRGLWVQGLVWALLTSPILFLLIRDRTRAQTGTTEGGNNVPFFALGQLSEGMKGVDVATLMLTYQEHLSKGESIAANQTLDTLEKVQPKDDAEWVTLDDLFRQAGRSASQRILSERHMATNPSHAGAQLRWIQLVQLSSGGRVASARVRSERPKAIELARTLLDRDDLTEQQMLEIGGLFQQWRENEVALQAYKRLLVLYPKSLRGEYHLLLLRSKMQSDDDLSGAIRHFRSRIPEVSDWYIFCADLASRGKDIALFEECVSHILGRMQTASLPANKLFVEAHVRLGRRQEVEEAYLALDYATISTEAALKKLLDLAEFYGFTGIALLACRRLVEVAPTKQLRVKLSQLEFFVRGV